MRRYKYSPLENETCIRLITIPPGNANDPIRAGIRHESLLPPKGRVFNYLSIEEIQRTLHEGWEVYKTLEVRMIFVDSEENETSWTQPDPIMNDVMSDSVLDSKTDMPSPAYGLYRMYRSPPEKKNKMIEIDDH